jgi:hypothetical protein
VKFFDDMVTETAIRCLPFLTRYFSLCVTGLQCQLRRLPTNRSGGVDLRIAINPTLVPLR